MCKLNDVLHACATFSEAFALMRKAADNIQQTTRSWSVKKTGGGSPSSVLLRCAVSKHATASMRDKDGKFIDKRQSNGGGGGKGRPKTITWSRRRFDCHALIELNIVDNNKVPAGGSKRTFCQKCGKRSMSVERHESHCTSQMPKDVFVCPYAACRKKMKNNAKSRKGHAFFCSAFLVVVSKVNACHAGHDHMFTRQALMEIGPLQKPYL